MNQKTTFYESEKEAVFAEINGKQIPYQLGKRYFAPTSSMPHSSRIHHVNRSNFKKTEAEKKIVQLFKEELGKTKNHKFLTLTHFTT